VRPGARAQPARGRDHHQRRRNFAAWVHRFFPFRRLGQHVAPDLRLDGLTAVPARSASSGSTPSAPSCASPGDGDFLMNAQEYATAAQYDLAVITVIADNGLYGTIRMHQEREYSRPLSATILKNPDFVAYARAFAASAWWWRRRRIFPRRSRRRRRRASRP